MSYLSSRGVRKALCTRNFALPVEHLLGKYLPEEVFDPIVTRETEGVPPKPRPDGLWWIARHWGLGREEKGDGKGRIGVEGKEEEDVLERAKRELGEGMIMVGDSIDDMSAGRRAGAATVLLVNEENEKSREADEVDLVIERLDELIDILEKGFEGR
jgi:phosphoglycolate phosphatase-like HAD superfamily hydrolase